MWLSMTVKRGSETVSLQSTLLKWAETRDKAVRAIDSCLGPLCNPVCPDKLAFVDTAVQWSEELNVVVVAMSLVLTVVSVLLKISFVVQSFLLRRARRESLQVK